MIDGVLKLKSIPIQGARRHEQAHEIWLILSGWIMMNNRSKSINYITYGELAEFMGYPRQAGRTLATPLGMISKFCIYNELPPMSVIVVTKDTQVPAWEGMVRKGYSLEEEQKNVFNIKWHRYRVPTATTFKKVSEKLEFPE